MQTLIRLENANCTACLEAVRDELASRPLVRSVRGHAAAGCLEVEHDHDDPDALVDLLQRSLRGWHLADNGEIVQIATVPEIAHVCASHGRADAPDVLARDPADLGGEAPCFAHLFDDEPRA